MATGEGRWGHKQSLCYLKLTGYVYYPDVCELFWVNEIFGSQLVSSPLLRFLTKVKCGHMHIIWFHYLICFFICLFFLLVFSLQHTTFPELHKDLGFWKWDGVQQIILTDLSCRGFVATYINYHHYKIRHMGNINLSALHRHSQESPTSSDSLK